MTGQKSDVEAFSLVLLARAKINLALHVVGRRDSGHHLLESIVTFADTGDRIGIDPSDEDRFTVSGPFSTDIPSDSDAAAGNLVVKARALLRDHLQNSGHAAPPVHLHLEKNLPVASGVGGGSADAAATLNGLIAHWKARIDADSLAGLALSLGADVPMCLAGHPLLACGIGEVITPLPRLPAMPMLLVNPGIAVSTPLIFQALVEKNNPALVLSPGAVSAEDWISALSTMRNDLQPSAMALTPLIADVLSAIEGSGARLTRMSGSGATCFGLFANEDSRNRAAEALRQQRPDWYVLPTNSLPGSNLPGQQMEIKPDGH